MKIEIENQDLVGWLIFQIQHTHIVYVGDVCVVLIKSDTHAEHKYFEWKSFSLITIPEYFFSLISYLMFSFSCPSPSPSSSALLLIFTLYLS